jgi:predicted nucleic acid-binding protein
MARLSLVIDASIAVKWYSAIGEKAIPQAVDILERISRNDICPIVPDLLYYEVTNALVHNKIISQEKMQTAVTNLFTLNLKTIPVDSSILATSIRLARRHDITIYDACYAVIAADYDCPLVTANPRHQKQELGCRVIPIEQWRGE